MPNVKFPENYQFRRLADRVNFAVQRHGFKNTMVDMEVSKSTLYRWMAQRGALDSISQIQSLSGVTGVSYIWMTNGLGTPDYELISLPKHYKALIQAIDAMAEAERDHIIKFLTLNHQRKAA